MASVSSLDKDLRNMRLGKYTPQAANEIREWIEETLGEPVKSGDLLEALKDGTALCKLANLCIGSPGVRFKQSSMPFTQMENISLFLRACQSPPLSLPPHDVFLTVDLYEAKDPTQVLQCIGAFSRRANALRPDKFPRAVGPKSKSGVLSPQSTGTTNFNRGRGASNASESSSSTFDPTSRPAVSRLSPSRTGGSVSGNASRTSGSGVSSWSKKTDQGATMPAWNIAQYGYMGGASQGNQGITFGGRRQITTPGPHVPSLAEKERKRREAEAEAEVLRIQVEEAEHNRRIEHEAEEERQRIAEERRWEEETRRQREQEKKAAEEEKRKWEEEERRWKEEEDQRLKEEREVEARLAKERQRRQTSNDTRLTGQFLSQSQAERPSIAKRPSYEDPVRTAERERVKELERQLEEAKERERQYESERQERLRSDGDRQLPPRPDTNGSLDDEPAPLRPKQTPQPQPASHSYNDSDSSIQPDEREYLRQAWSNSNSNSPRNPPSSSTPTPSAQTAPSSSDPAPPPQPLRPLPSLSKAPTYPTRPLPNPQTYTPPQPQPQPQKPPRASPFARPPPSTTSQSKPLPPTSTSTPTPTPKPTSTSSSLLEREMELERQRQAEWESSQRALQDAAAKGIKDPTAGTGVGQSWDVNQYGYLGGDSQNRGAEGINFGGRRQILGPRPLGGGKRG